MLINDRVEKKVLLKHENEEQDAENRLLVSAIKLVPFIFFI